MSTPQDADRAAAVLALRTHLASGLLDPGEYESREVAVNRATDWSQLEAAFTGLPEPRIRRPDFYGTPEAAPGDPTSHEQGAPPLPSSVMVPSGSSGQMHRASQWIFPWPLLLVAFVLMRFSGRMGWIWFVVIGLVFMYSRRRNQD